MLETGLKIPREKIYEYVFDNVKKLGFEKKSFDKLNRENEKIFHHPNFRGIHFQLAELRICRLALSQFIQENIDKLEKNPAILEALDEKFLPYDKNLSGIVIQPNKTIVDLPDADENWLRSIPNLLPESLDLEKKYFTVFSSTKTFSARSPYAYEFNAISSALVENEITEDDPRIARMEFYEMHYTAKARSLLNFKNESIVVPTVSTVPYRFIVFKEDKWQFNFDSKLIKLTNEFMDKYGLEWDESTFLDTKNQREKITKYTKWNNGYLSDSYTRERKSDGATLEINTKFLNKILKKESLSLLQVHHCYRSYYERYEDHNNDITERKIITPI